MNIKFSQYFEMFYKLGVSTDEKGKDPQKVVRPRTQYMDQSTLQAPDQINWTYCFHPHAPQIFGNNGKKFGDGEYGIGQTPNWFLPGTPLCATKLSASGQDTILLGAIPTTGKSETSDSGEF